MANPTHATLTDIAAQALGGTLDPGIGLTHLSLGQDDQSNPKLYAQLTTNFDVLYKIVGRLMQGMVFQSATALTIEAFALPYMIGTTAYNFVGGSLLLAASGTHKIYLDAAQTLKSTTGAWPADVVKLAIVTTDPAQVTNIEESRHSNYGIGGSNSWYNVPALAPPSINGLNIKNVGGIGVAMTAAKTIVAGSATVTKEYTPIHGESSANDDLVTLVNGDESGLGRVVLTGDTGGGTITVKSGVGNINLINGDATLLPVQGLSQLTLMYNAQTGNWDENSRNLQAPSTLNGDLNAGGGAYIRDLGGLEFDGVVAAITGGSFARTRSMHVLVAEAGTTDDLNTITGGTDDELLILRASSTHTITVKHALIAEGFSLANGKDFVLDSGGTLICRYNGPTARWNEVSRSPMKVSDLAGTDNAIYQLHHIAIPGALSIGKYFVKIKVDQAMVIKSASVEVDTAPVTTDLIVDVEVNGLSMFNNQAEMARVVAGASSGNSIVKNKQVNAGETIQVEVELASGAANATVTLHTYSSAVEPVVAV